MSSESLWQLKIPVRLALAQDEISSPGDVKPAYLLAPRFAYLPALAQQSLSVFQHVLLNLPGQAPTCTPWFEFTSLPLNWTQPLGVLHDLLTPQPAQPAQQPPQQEHQPSQPPPGFRTTAIPWSLTVHYRNQPASLSNSWQNSGTAKDHFFTSLKEAGYCCRGTDGVNAVMRLTGAEQDELWAAVNRGDGAAVRTVTAPLRLIPSVRQGSPIASVPVRLYIREHTAANAADPMGVWQQVYSTSRALEVSQPDGSATLLAHLAHTVLPQRFPAPQQPPGTTGQSSRAGTPQQDDKQQQHQQHQQQQQQRQQRQQHHAQQPAPNVQQGTQQQAPPELHAAVEGTEAQHQGDAPSTETASPADDPLGVLTSTPGGLGRPSSPAAAAVVQQPPGVSQQQQQQAASAAAPVGPSPQDSSGAGSGLAGVDNPTQAMQEDVQGAQGSVSDRGGVVLPQGWPSQCAAFVCGVQPDWCTPLGWLHANFKAADGFLYVVMHLKGA